MLRGSLTNLEVVEFDPPIPKLVIVSTDFAACHGNLVGHQQKAGSLLGGDAKPHLPIDLCPSFSILSKVSKPSISLTTLR